MDETAGADAVLRATDLRKTYGSVVAVDRAGMTIGAGEVVALCGDNGAGKTTFVKMLTGVVQPDSGTIGFRNEEVNFKNPLEARVAGIETVHQSLALVDTFDIATNIFLGRELTWLRLGSFSPMKRGEMRREAKRRIETTGVRISDVRHQVNALSGGQRQGAAIARAVGWGAKLVVFDEPTAALGVRETEQVEEIILNLRSQGVSCLIISHNLRQVLRLADKVYVMRQGRTVGSGNCETLSEERIVAMITGLAGGPEDE
jgi:ABC-type sugar transport system ATPase subunit